MKIGDDLVVQVAAEARPASDAAVIGIFVRDPARADALTRAITDAIAAAALPPVPANVVLLRSRERLEQVTDQLPGAIAIVGVTRNNARHLVELISGCRAAGAAGVQLVWSTPEDRRAQRHVFAALELARGTPASAPVVLSRSTRPAAALQLLIAHRTGRANG